MTHGVHETAEPVDIGIFRCQGLMLEPDDLTHPVNRLSFVHMSEESTGGGGTSAVQGSELETNRFQACNIRTGRRSLKDAGINNEQLRKEGRQNSWR